MATEIALLLPLLVMLSFGIISFWLAYSRLDGIEEAARTAARVGASDPGAECAAAAGSLSDPAISSTCSVEHSCPGDRVVVFIEATSDLDIPFVGDRRVTRTARGEFECLN